MILWSSVDTDSAMTEAKTCFGLPPFFIASSDFGSHASTSLWW